MPKIRQVRGLVRHVDGSVRYTDWFTDDGSEKVMDALIKLVRTETGEYRLDWERRNVEVQAGLAD